MNVTRKQIMSVRYWDNWFTRTTPRVADQVLLGVYIVTTRFPQEVTVGLLLIYYWSILMGIMSRISIHPGHFSYLPITNQVWWDASDSITFRFNMHTLAVRIVKEYIENSSKWFNIVV